MYSFGIAPPTILFSICHTLSALARFDFHHDVPVLTAAAGLLDQFPFTGGVLGNRFAIGYLRFTRVGIDLELTQASGPE